MLVSSSPVNMERLQDEVNRLFVVIIVKSYEKCQENVILIFSILFKKSEARAKK